MQELELLKAFCDNTEAREKIDSFIGNIHKTFNSDYKDKDTQKIKDFFTKSFDEFKILKSQTASSFNFTQDTIMLYFSMDKVIFPAMHESIYISEYKTLTVPTSDNSTRTYSVSGRNVQDLYLYGHDAGAMVLESHAYIFPESTKSYLLRKKDERETVNFESLENEFQARILVSKMDEKFKIGKFRTVLKSFYKTTNWQNSNKTFTLLHNAVDKRYSSASEKDRELVEKFLAEVVHNIFKSGHNYYLLSSFGQNTVDSLKDMLSNPTMLKSFVRATTMYKSYESVSIMSYFLAEGEMKEACDNGIYSMLCNQTQDNSLNFTFASEALKKLAIEEAKIQFLNKHVLLKDFLLKEGFIEEFKDRLTEAKLSEKA